MEKISVALLSFLANAGWQVALVAAVASVAARFLRRATAQSRHALWVVALLVAFALPLLAFIPFVRQTREHKAISAGAVATRNAVAADPLLEPAYETSASVPGAKAPGTTFPPSRLPHDLSVPIWFANVLLIVYAAFVFWRGAGLIFAWLRTRALVQSSTTAEFPQAVQDVIARCVEQTRVGAVRFLTSPAVPAPLTVGAMPPIIVLPENLVAERDEALLVSAVGHELVHIARRDYLLNFVYRLFYIPLSFHPAAALIKRRIDETRELRCDEVVTDRLLSPAAYARSLVTLAGAAHAFRRPATVAVGIADADILEERIMSMLKKRRISSARRMLLLATAALVFAIPCIAAAPYAMHLKVQSTEHPATIAAAMATFPSAPSAKPERQQEPAKTAAADDKTIGFVYAPQSQEPSQEESAARLKRKIAEEKIAQQREILEKKLADGQLTPEQAAELKKKLEQATLLGEVQLSPEERAARQKREEEELAARARHLAELSKAAKITMQQAIDAALRQQPGTVMESALVGERKFLLRRSDGSVTAGSFANNEGSPAQPMYRIVIISGDENAPVRTIVLVSAIDGSILRTAVE